MGGGNTEHDESEKKYSHITQTHKHHILERKEWETFFSSDYDMLMYMYLTLVSYVFVDTKMNVLAWRIIL